MATTPPLTPADILPETPDGFVAGFPGDLADIGLKDTISRQNRGTEPIPFGAAVVDSEDGWPSPIGVTPPNHDIGCELYSAGKRVIGFAKSEYGITAAQTNSCTGLTGFGSYPPGSTVQVLRDCRMRQLADGEVHPGDPVRVNAQGIVTASGGTVVPGCTWETHSLPKHCGIIQILITPAAPAGAGAGTEPAHASTARR
jgi:hypothetical protein